MASIAAAFLVLLCATSCSTVKQTSEISGLRDEWLQKFRHKEIDAVIAMYAPGAAFMPPKGAAIIGATAIRDHYRMITATFDSDMALRSRVIEASGSLAYDTGEFSETMTTILNGQTQQYTGQYLMVYRRIGGQWRIVQHVWTLGP